jgi:Winged helix DNA-binding domain
VATLTRKQLTAALAARQMLLERRRVSPAEAIRLLTPLQGQDSPAPYVALAARLEGFAPPDLQAALDRGDVVKTTIMRVTLHLAAGADFPAYAQLARQTRLRKWRKDYPHLDEERVVAELARWLRNPRSNEEIRERVLRYDGVPDNLYTPLILARTLVPLVHLPPSAYWRSRQRPRFVIDPRPLPDPAAAATLVLKRYLAAFGPASRRDLAGWAGVAQRDFTDALERVDTVSFEDENGVELLDLPDQPLPPASDHPPGGAAAEADA